MVLLAQVSHVKDIDQDITGRYLLVEILLILVRLKNLCNLFKERNAASVKIATLLISQKGAEAAHKNETKTASLVVTVWRYHNTQLN